MAFASTAYETIEDKWSFLPNLNQHSMGSLICGWPLPPHQRILGSNPEALPSPVSISPLVPTVRRQTFGKRLHYHRTWITFFSHHVSWPILIPRQLSMNAFLLQAAEENLVKSMLEFPKMRLALQLLWSHNVWSANGGIITRKFVRLSDETKPHAKGKDAK